MKPKFNKQEGSLLFGVKETSDYLPNLKSA